MDLEDLQYKYTKILELQSQAEARLADAKTIYEAKLAEAEQINTKGAKQEAEVAKQVLQEAQSKVEAVDTIKTKIEIEIDLAENQLRSNSGEDILDELGLNVLSTKENQDRSFQIGNYAHENAEEFIPESKLPLGLDNERTIVVDGETVRLDRVDWQNAMIYEIKPETTDDKQIDGYRERLNEYLNCMDRAHPREDGKSWRGDIIYYDSKEVENHMIEKGILEGQRQTQVMDNSRNCEYGI